MNRKKDIIKAINDMSGKYSSYDVFTDWIRCCSLAISNSCQLVHDKVWNDREQIYLDTVRKYTKSEVQKFVEMFEMLAETFEDYTSDVLGEIYMESRMGNKATGQFFTPFHLSVLCAKMVEENLKPDADGIYYLNEPSVGGGGMVIAAAVVLKEKGINYQKKLRVVAQDLDWKGVYMSYLQFSLLGINAVCVQGNTLSEPYVEGNYPMERVLYTPMKRGILL